MSRWRCECGYIVDNVLCFGTRCPHCHKEDQVDQNWIYLDIEESERLWEEQQKKRGENVFKY